MDMQISEQDILQHMNALLSKNTLGEAARQEGDEIPADGNDIGMDIIVTGNGIIRYWCRYADIDQKP